MTDKLEAEMPTMLSEHKESAAALKNLKDAAMAENKPAGVQFAEHLAAHAQTEEEITHPTALLIGRYVKSSYGVCALIAAGRPKSFDCETAAGFRVPH